MTIRILKKKKELGKRNQKSKRVRERFLVREL